MRDLNECQAEVFRRSEKRIKARCTRTIRTLAICIPVVLCLVGIPLLSGGFPGSSREPVTTVTLFNGPGGEEHLSFTCSVAKITVSGPDFSRTITEISDIVSVSNSLLVYDTDSAGSGIIANETVQDVNTAATDDHTQSTPIFGDIIVGHSATAGYTVTLVMHDGTKTLYSLAGTTLRNLSTGQVYLLPQQEAENLAQLLGLSQ